MVRRNLLNTIWRTEMNTYNEFFFQSIELIEQFKKTRSEKQVYKILVEENDIPVLHWQRNQTKKLELLIKRL